MSEIIALEGKVREYREYLLKLELLHQEGKVTDEVYQELKNIYSRELEKYENELKKRLAKEEKTQVTTTGQDSYTLIPPKPVRMIEHTLSNTTIIKAKKAEAMPTLVRVAELGKQRVRIAKAFNAFASRLRRRVETEGKLLAVERIKGLIIEDTLEPASVFTILSFVIICLFITPIIFAVLYGPLIGFIIAILVIVSLAVRNRTLSSFKHAVQHHTSPQLEGTKVYPFLHGKKAGTKNGYYWRESKIEDVLEPASLSFILFILFTIVFLPIYIAVVFDPLFAFIIAIISIVTVIAGYHSGSS
ncbi:MAG: hypothetical protein QXM43_05940 [Desulfurococcaceae archaeon]